MFISILNMIITKNDPYIFIYDIISKVYIKQKLLLIYIYTQHFCKLNSYTPTQYALIYIMNSSAISSGNPLEEKHSGEGDWRDLVPNKLKKLSKLDGKSNRTVFTVYLYIVHSLHPHHSCPKELF